MPALRSQVLDPHSLSFAELDALVDRVSGAWGRIFRSAPRAQVLRALHRQDAARSRVQVVEDEDGQCVGFAWMHFYELRTADGPATVMHTAFELESRWRGQAPSGNLLATEALRYRALNPGRALWGLQLVQHPENWRRLARFVPGLLPHPDRELPEALRAFILDVARVLELATPSPLDPLIRDTERPLRMSRAQQQWWASSAEPEVRWFLERNPGYAEGQALITVSPLTTSDLMRSFSRFSRTRLSASLGAAGVALRKAGSAGPSGVELLRQVPLLQGLPQAVLVGLEDAAARKAVSADGLVFRRGDAPDAAYVVVEGSARVLLDEGPDALPVAHIDAGEMFGELGLLLDQPRSATVQAASDLELLRIDAPGFDRMLDAHPDLASRLWQTAAERAVVSELMNTGRFGHLPPERARRWAEGAETLRLGPGGSLTMRQEWLVLLLRGAAELTDPARWHALRAPALLSLAPGATLYARGGPLILARLPPRPPD